MSVSIEISGLLIAQLKYDFINSGGNSWFFLTTDESEDKVASRTAIVVTSFVPMAQGNEKNVGTFLIPLLVKSGQ
ncbi:hypothetical protein HDU98_004812 [Podochytrium sp. JEL0797]|nr:hypothetical protein HDU98_004812 [Podochytrium sp. JEL0797]